MHGNSRNARIKEDRNVAFGRSLTFLPCARKLLVHRNSLIAKIHNTPEPFGGKRAGT